MNQWLDACVTMERAVSDTRFVKKKSKQVARVALLVLVLFTFATSIHDPTPGHFIEEEKDE